MLIFHEEPLFFVIHRVKQILSKEAKVQFAVPDPDKGAGLYAGELLAAGERHRPWRVWFDLAEKLECRFLTPERFSESHVLISLEKLPALQLQTLSSVTEKYGAASEFARIQKLEESSLLLDYLEALGRIPLETGNRVLSLGVNRAEEWKLFDYLGVKGLEYVGIDHSSSALEEARKTFPGPNYHFIEADINQLDHLKLGKFHLLMALGTLQSPGIDDRAVLRYCVQQLIETSGSLLFAFPNAKYQDAELLYGARMKNFAQAELSLLVKDLAFYRKYLHQHDFKVFITGKYYSLITAVRNKT
ncbi:MAG: class I SAM-dependent methyltransferase [Trueperaceae bacterium]|nr:class I SAM-dependent methyltransferase [Trueperaceae bacterium]